MTQDKSKSECALILTVGTGNKKNLEDSLFAPLEKSMNTGEWQRIVLLPSLATYEYAQILRERNPELPIEIESPPGDGLENDADECFGHFDKVISQLIDHGLAPDQITADFTRGTKAMSAALVLAVAGRKIPTLRYIDGVRRDDGGTVQAGTEKVREVETALTTARRRIDDAKALMQHGNFSAVIELLKVSGSTSSNPVAKSMEDESKAIAAVASVYAAWDRLNYGDAFAAINDAVVNHDGDFSVSPKVRDWLKQLSQQPEKTEHKAMARYLRTLVCDLVANGERCITAGQFEDALVRGYRVLELLGQIRLFDQGMDSAAIPAEKKQVKELRDDLIKNKSRDFKENKDKTLEGSKELVARLLMRMGDKLGEELQKFDKDERMKASWRNHSILNHGFGAMAPSEPGPLKDMFRRLCDLLIKDDREAKRRISIARHMDFR